MKWIKRFKKWRLGIQLKEPQLRYAHVCNELQIEWDNHLDNLRSTLPASRRPIPETIIMLNTAAVRLQGRIVTLQQRLDMLERP